MNKYKELIVWQKAVALAAEICTLTKRFPTTEQFVLTSQINRSAISAASNIAEGAGRNTAGEFKSFLGISTGSLYELETQLTIALKLNYITEGNLEALAFKIEEIQKLIGGLMKSLNKTKQPPTIVEQISK
jgi:four helix bundle protein